MKLKMTAERAQKLIQHQIEKIPPLLLNIERDNINMDNEFEAFKNSLQKWRDFNRDLLKQIYESESISSDYIKLNKTKVYYPDATTFESYELVKSRIRGEVSFLESCLERLPLYQEMKTGIDAIEVGSQFTSYSKLSEIVSSAQMGICVVDAFVDYKVLNLLSIKQTNIPATLLTKRKSITEHFKGAAAKFETQFGHLEVRTIETIHDRILIIDDSKVFLSGASFKDLGKQTSSFIRIEDPSVSKTWSSIIQANWIKADPVTF